MLLLPAPRALGLISLVVLAYTVALLAIEQLPLIYAVAILFLER